MQVIRSRPEANFTQITNSILRDHRLSHMARGVLAEMLSHADGWTTTADRLWQQARTERPWNLKGEGQRAYRAVFAQLEKAGYLERQRLRTKTGTFETVLILHDEPVDTAATASTDVAVTQPRLSPAETPRLPSSDRRCGNGTSVTATSSRTPSTKHSLEEHGSSDDEQGRSPDGAQPDGRAAHNGRILCDVRAAIAHVYGERENIITDDEDLLAAWGQLMAERQDAAPIRNRVAWLEKILADFPYLDGFLGRFGTADDQGSSEEETSLGSCPRCQRPYGNGSWPTEHGVCIWCDAELASNQQASS